VEYLPREARSNRTSPSTAVRSRRASSLSLEAWKTSGRVSGGLTLGRLALGPPAFEHRLAFLVQVAAQDRRQPRAVARLERLDHLRVLASGLVPLVLIEVRAEAQVLDPLVEIRVHLGQQVVARRAVDALVDQPVDPVVRRQVAPGVAREHLEGQRFHLGDLLRDDLAAGQFPGERLERAHHFEAFADVVVGQRDDLGAAIGLQLDEMLGGQQAERLAQRRARGAQPVAQRALVQARARRQFAFDDEFPQAIGQRLREGRCARRGTGQRGESVGCVHVGIPKSAYCKNAKEVIRSRPSRIFPLAQA
jgi:hypothetical protein